MDGTGPRLALVEVAGASIANLRGRAWQDRWSTGQGPVGTWLVVTDGVSGGNFGGAAAQSAVNAAVAQLSASDLGEGAVLAAFAAAQAAVAPWYVDEHGGTTMSIATLRGQHLTVGAVGDSPVLQSDEQGWLHRVTAPPPRGPLQSWIGQQGTLYPDVSIRPLHESSVVVVATDGARLPRFVGERERATEICANALHGPRHHDDDATVVVARRRPVGPPRPELDEEPRGETDPAASVRSRSRTTPRTEHDHGSTC